MEPATNSRPLFAAPVCRLLTGLTILAIVFVLYGSWLPFDFRWSSGTQLLASPRWCPSTFGDAVTNIVIYIPISLFLAMRLMVTGRSRCTLVLVTVSIAALTIALAEMGQVALPRRVASYTDMMFNGVGTIIGLALAPWAIWVAIRLRSRLKLALALRPMHALFWIVAALVVFAKLAPFDFTVLPADFQASLADARWSPFDPALASSVQLVDDLIEVAGSFFGFVLLGVFGGLAAREAGQSRLTGAVNTMATIILLAVGVEALQLVIRSHSCDAADVITYVWGGTLGAILGAAVLDRRPRQDRPGKAHPAGKLLLSLALVMQVAMAVANIEPGKMALSAVAVSPIQWIPFYAQFQMSFASGCGQLIASFLWYATLATMVSIVLARHRGRPVLLIVACITVATVAVTEAVQVFSVQRTADVTELVMALFAALVAATVFRWVERYRQASPLTAAVEILEPGSTG